MQEQECIFKIQSALHQKVSKQEIIPLQKAKNSCALLYVLEGQGTVYYDQDFLGVKHHDVLVIDLEKDAYYSSDDMDLVFVKLQGLLLGEVLPSNFLFTIENHHDFYQSLVELKNQSGKDSYQQIKDFLHMLSFLHDQRNSYKIKQNIDPMQEAVRYIEDHFSQQIDVDKIAKHTGFSTYYFIRKFKGYQGKTPYQYILHIRLEHAKYLLKYTNKALKQIAEESGFNSDISFINSFTKHLDLSPTTYRKTKER